MKELLGRSIAAISTGVLVCVCLSSAPAAGAGYSSGFEGLDASPGGMVLTGQDGFYIPSGTTSTDWFCYTYEGNTLGLPQNPYGGLNFVGGLGPGDGSTYARAQRDVDYGTSSEITIAYDFAAAFQGSGESVDNVGSFSTQLYPGEATYIQLMSWVDPLNPVAYKATYYAYQADGSVMDLPGQLPGDAWNNLALDHWYRSWTTFDLDTNRITSVGIMDLTSGDEASFDPADWYMEGGAAGGLGAPSGFRFFAGGGTGSANSLAFDRLSIVPGPASLALLTLGGLGGLLRRRRS